MRPIIQEIVRYTQRHPAGELLREAEHRFGATDLRFLCGRLAIWWYGDAFADPPRVFTRTLRVANVYPWQESIRQLVGSVASLGELIAADEVGLHVRSVISAEEMEAVQEWVHDNYRPYIHFNIT